LQKLIFLSFSEVFFPLLNLRSIQLCSAYWKTCYFLHSKRQTESLVSASLQYSNMLFFSSFENVDFARPSEDGSVFNLVLRIDSNTSRSSAVHRSSSLLFRQFIIANTSVVNFNYPFVLMSYFPIACNSKI
jgi:hypothetical protein